MTGKEIPAGHKMAANFAQDPLLVLTIKVNDHVTAKNNVERYIKPVIFIEEIQSAEGNKCPDILGYANQAFRFVPAF